jgi:hypothetical protein
MLLLLFRDYLYDCKIYRCFQYQIIPIIFLYIWSKTKKVPSSNYSLHVNFPLLLNFISVNVSEDTYILRIGRWPHGFEVTLRRMFGWSCHLVMWSIKDYIPIWRKWRAPLCRIRTFLYWTVVNHVGENVTCGMEFLWQIVMITVTKFLDYVTDFCGKHFDIPEKLAWKIIFYL